MYREKMRALGFPDYIEILPDHVDLPEACDVEPVLISKQGERIIPLYCHIYNLPAVGVMLDYCGRYSEVLPLRPTQQQVDEALVKMCCS